MTLVHIVADQGQIEHFMVYYQWTDVLIYVIAMGWLMYVLCKMLVVPSKEFLFDYMLASTTIL